MSWSLTWAGGWPCWLLELLLLLLLLLLLPAWRLVLWLMPWLELWLRPSSSEDNIAVDTHPVPGRLRSCLRVLADAGSSSA